MPLKLYNHLSRKKEQFRPLSKNRVGLYTCGPTVYNYAHIGNLRTYIFEDVLRRTLEYFDYSVRQVMNLTDVDDKTIRDSKKAGKTLEAFTQFYAKKFFADVKRLNILPAWKYPRATKHVKEMIRLINVLLKKRLAYRAENGVYFDISRFRPYGKLSRVKQRKLKAGSRIAADEYSKDEVEDFALWKAKKPNEPSWNADFEKGRLAPAKRGEARPGVMPGRPGWHIECSAMSMKYLGSTFDIHAGAVDLLFPHHEDEIAQSEGATQKPFVKYFVEGEHLLVDGKKMSKSLGNIYTLRDLENRGFDPLAFRYFVLGAHYRTRLNFTWKGLEGSQNALEKLRAFPAELKGSKGHGAVLDRWKKKFEKSLADDLNVPGALAVLWDLVHSYRKAPEKFSPQAVRALVLQFDRVLGLNLQKGKKFVISLTIKTLVEKREALRNEKRWKEADAIREKVRKLGFVIEDTPSGPMVKRKMEA